MITLEGADWANDWSVFGTPFDSNLFYQFHYYCWDRPTKLNDISRFVARRAQLNAPVWVGETGEKDNVIYWGTTQYFEANNIGWSFWPWKKMDATNGLNSVKAPQDWNAIRSYTGGAPAPSPEAARKSFDELLENIKLQNCVFYPDVANALFRRVPGRIEAENYGHDGQGKSYFVKDPMTKSPNYRTAEPVPVEPVAGANRRNPGQAVKLAEGEWTTYTVNSQTAKDFPATLKARADGGPAVIEVSASGQVQETTVAGGDWAEIAMKAVSLAQGNNSLKLRVKSGTASLDWIALGTAAN